MNEPKVLIAKESDTHGINQVITKHNLSKPKYFKDRWEMDLFDIVKSEKNIVFIIKNGNEIIGYLALHSNYPFSQNDGDAEFEIVVDPEIRKKRIGKTLLKFAVRYANNQTSLKQIKAKIEKGNIAPKKLCESCGFHLLYCESNGFVMILELIR